MTWVKICGMTNLEDALMAVDAGADAVGFVFYEKSPRCVSVETAREICEKLPDSVEKVGVFVATDADAVSDISEQSRLDKVQCYSNFHSPCSIINDEFLEKISCRVIFAIPAIKLVSEVADDPTAIAGFRISQTFKDRIAAVLLDSGNLDRPGGTGNKFEWKNVTVMTDLIKRTDLNLVVAGGLTAQNVGEAMEILKPWGVDVVSGVEASPGKKDPEKVRAFVRAVREADRKVG